MMGKILHGGLDIEPFDFRMVIILSGNAVSEVSLPSTGFNVDGVFCIGDDWSFILVSESLFFSPEPIGFVSWGRGIEFCFTTLLLFTPIITLVNIR